MTVSLEKYFQVFELKKPEGREWWSLLERLDMSERREAIVWLYQQKIIDNEQVWDVLSNYAGPVNTITARLIYEDLGLVPFAGFPLKKAGE